MISYIIFGLKLQLDVKLRNLVKCLLVTLLLLGFSLVVKRVLVIIIRLTRRIK